MPPNKPRVAPIITPQSSWTKLAGCPMPWEESGPSSPHLIGTDGHGPLHPQALTWGVGYYFAEGMLRAAFDYDSSTHEEGTGIAETEDTSAEAEGEAAASNTSASASASAEAKASKKGDTWLIERSTPGSCAADAGFAGHILTSPRLEELGSMGVEVWYGFNDSSYGNGGARNGQERENKHEGRVKMRSSWVEEETEEEKKAKMSLWGKMRTMVNAWKKQVSV